MSTIVQALCYCDGIQIFGSRPFALIAAVKAASFSLVRSFVRSLIRSFSQTFLLETTTPRQRSNLIVPLEQSNKLSQSLAVSSVQACIPHWRFSRILDESISDFSVFQSR